MVRFALGIFLYLSYSFAPSQPIEPTNAQEFRIGLIAEPQETACTGKNEAQACDYIRWIITNSDSVKDGSVKIKVAVGSHWEIDDWLRRREIDAAITSAVSDYALRRISGIEPEAELAAPNASAFGVEGVRPAMVIGGTLADDMRKANKDPNDLRTYFEAIEVCKGYCQQRVYFQAPTHLSSSRFVFPLLMAQKWYNDDRHNGNYSPCKGDRKCPSAEKRAEFWAHLLAAIRFRAAGSDPCIVDRNLITFTSFHESPAGCDKESLQPYVPENYVVQRVPFDRLLVWRDRAKKAGLTFHPNGSVGAD